VVKPPEKNKKLVVEFHFDDKKVARRLVWFGKKATIKTYVIEDENSGEHKIKITRKEKKGPGSKINITTKGKRISVEYINIRLGELLKRFSELGKMKFKASKELSEKIRVNLTMKNFTPEEAIKALANMENLLIKKLDNGVYLVTRKESPGE